MHLNKTLVLIWPNTELYSDKLVYQSKKGGKDQDSIQSNTTPDPGCHMGKLGRNYFK